MQSTRILLVCAASFLFACSPSSPPESAESIPAISTSHASEPLSDQMRDYWFAGDAELSSYHLTQARYGELREGNAVLVFVSEPFSKTKQVKLDRGGSKDAVTVLKMNQTRKFNTGIYPYSMMTSVFSPMEDGSAIKATTSSQEWCGHTWSQLNQTDGGYRFEQRSYFESEGDQEIELKNCVLEDELWNAVRLNPYSLGVPHPVKMVPGTQFLRLSHLPVQAYEAEMTYKHGHAGESMLHVEYKDLERTLTLFFTADFPHTITRWEETYRSGFGANAQVMTTTATLNKRIKVPYWNLNHNADSTWRKELGLN